MKRRELRESIFQILFRVEFNSKDEMAEQLELFFEDMEETIAVKASDLEYMKNKYALIVEKIPEIDALLNSRTSGWKTSRMGKVELTILRLAVYEMRYDEDVPVNVAINEAVELAKKFGGDDTPAFVNGVLGKIVETEE